MLRLGASLKSMMIKKKSLLYSSRFWHWLIIYPLALIGLLMVLLFGSLFFEEEYIDPVLICTDDYPCYDQGDQG